MPVVNFHLVEGCATHAQVGSLLKAASRLYADVLESPVDRVRAFATFRSPFAVAVGGELMSHNKQHAPYFEFIVLEGRSLEQRQRLLAGFTELLVETLGVERNLVRGRCLRVLPEEWGIEGRPASEMRAKEIEERARTGEVDSHKPR